MNFKFLAKVLKLIISLNTLLLFFIPIGYSFTSRGMAIEPRWNPDYFYTDSFFFILLAPFYLFWGIYLFNTDGILKNILTFLLICSSAFYSYMSFPDMFTINQYGELNGGLVIIFSFFPFLIMLFILEKKGLDIGTRMDLDVDNILDENNLDKL